MTANACSRLGAGKMKYELVVPPVSEAEEEFCHSRLSPETPVGYYLAKGVEKFGSWLPEGGFRYNERPTVPFEELTKR